LWLILIFGWYCRIGKGWGVEEVFVVFLKTPDLGGKWVNIPWGRRCLLEGAAVRAGRKTW
jgi:hypothetical protein